MRTLLLDNYDSFTYNLRHLMRSLGQVDVEVRRNDRLTLEEAEQFDRIVLSPGPGLPAEAGIMPELVKTFAPSRPIFGVCLGMQCIGEIFGAQLVNLGRPVHGRGVRASVVSEDLLFRGLPREFIVGRYHSWVVDGATLPSDLQATAVDDRGYVMALRHRQYPTVGVQFHPESVLTEHGAEIMANWLRAD